MTDFKYKISKRKREGHWYVTVTSKESPGYDALRKVLDREFGIAIAHITSGGPSKAIARMRDGWGS